ncbi:MAG TPA: MlaD family protein [Thermoanaerobaculia bacterium]|nr:MlaD family protein [Thermoanaerobaculia bacterium]
MSSAAKLGVLMLVILAIVGYFVLKIEDIDVGRGKGTRKVTVAFDDVAGLDVKSAVRVAGVRKGKVSDVRVESGKAVVTLDVDDDVQIHRNATARVANLGLLGEKYVELDPGTPGAGVVTGESIRLPGSQPASIDDVTTQVSEIANDIKAITESLKTVMASPQGQQSLEDIVENVRDITAQMRQLVAANRNNVDATMANVRDITASLRVEIPKLAASLDRAAGSVGGTVGENREDVRRLVDNLRTLSADLRVTTENLNAITGQVKSGEGTVGKLLYSEEAHQRLTTALGSVESGVNELRTTLGRANQIGLDIGIKADYYAGRSNDADEDGDEAGDFGGNSRTAVGLRLVPNPEKNRFYNVELSDDPRGKRRDKVTVENITDSLTGGTRTITTRTTKFDRDFLVSAQVGWVLDDLALRIGLFDSAGGVGADYSLSDRLRVSGEVFDFGQKRDDNPHIRVFGEYTFRRESEKLPRVFFTSGVDNALNDTAITFGGGIRWRDDDLKYLLGSIPLGR